MTQYYANFNNYLYVTNMVNMPSLKSSQKYLSGNILGCNLQPCKAGNAFVY